MNYRHPKFRSAFQDYGYEDLDPKEIFKVPQNRYVLYKDKYNTTMGISLRKLQKILKKKQIQYLPKILHHPLNLCVARTVIYLHSETVCQQLTSSTTIETIYYDILANGEEKIEELLYTVTN